MSNEGLAHFSLFSYLVSYQTYKWVFLRTRWPLHKCKGFTFTCRVFFCFWCVNFFCRSYTSVQVQMPCQHFPLVVSMFCSLQSINLKLVTGGNSWFCNLIDDWIFTSGKQPAQLRNWLPHKKFHCYSLQLTNVAQYFSLDNSTTSFLCHLKSDNNHIQNLMACHYLYTGTWIVLEKIWHEIENVKSSIVQHRRSTEIKCNS